MLFGMKEGKNKINSHYNISLKTFSRRTACIYVKFLVSTYPGWIYLKLLGLSKLNSKRQYTPKLNVSVLKIVISVKR